MQSMEKQQEMRYLKYKKCRKPVFTPEILHFLYDTLFVETVIVSGRHACYFFKDLTEVIRIVKP